MACSDGQKMSPMHITLKAGVISRGQCFYQTAKIIKKDRVSLSDISQGNETLFCESFICLDELL